MAELERRLRLALAAEAGAAPPAAAARIANEAAPEGSEVAVATPPAGDPANEDGEVPEDLREGGDVGDLGFPDELPAIGELTARLRPEVTTLLDELFRARWTTVRRVRPEHLKRGP